MLKILRTGQRWLTAILVAGIGTVFVVFLGLQGPSDFTSSQQIVKVGPLEFGIADFERVRERHEQMMQAQQGDHYNSRAMRETLDQLAANDLVQTGLLALAAEDLGLQVSTREIERNVLSDPGLRDEQGKFDRELFDGYVQQVYGSQKAFMAERRLALLSMKMLSLLQSQPEVSEGEAREATRRDLEEVQIAFVSLDPGPGDPPEIAPEAIAAAISGRAEEIAKIYEQQGEIYNRPERVHVRHIFKRLDKDAPPADVDRVRGEIEAAAKRIADGEPFETVAAEVSDDPGAKTSGGDLEPFARGGVPKPLEDAAFALTQGQVSSPVRTDYGFHLVKLEERLEALTRPLESVREEIAAELLQREALRERARARAEQLAEAVRGGKTLEAAAREQGIAMRHSGWLSRRNRYVPGLGNSPDALAAAFVLAPGTSSPRVFDAGEEFALVHLLERREPTADQVAALVEKKSDELLAAKRQARIGAWMEAHRAALEESGELEINLEPVTS